MLAFCTVTISAHFYLSSLVSLSLQIFLSPASLWISANQCFNLPLSQPFFLLSLISASAWLLVFSTAWSFESCPFCFLGLLISLRFLLIKCRKWYQHEYLSWCLLSTEMTLLQLRDIFWAWLIWSTICFLLILLIHNHLSVIVDHSYVTSGHWTLASTSHLLQPFSLAWFKLLNFLPLACQTTELL